MKHNVFDDAETKPEEKRKSIFELYKQNNTMERDFNRIRLLLDSNHGVVSKDFQGQDCSVKDIAADEFPQWKNRGRCLNYDDFLSTIGIERIEKQAPYNENMFLLYIELTYNTWYMADAYVSCHSYYYRWGKDGIQLREMMDEVLSEMNQKAYYDSETEQCLIGEDSPQITAAVEATEPETASQILHYNHRQLAGKISEKKGILQNLAKYLEGRESELKPINMQLFTDLNTAFNNLDIRHNNIVQRDSSDYKEKLAQMTPEELEKWYDDVYQLILLAILEMDNVDRRKRLRTLIQDINQK